MNNTSILETVLAILSTLYLFGENKFSCRRKFIFTSIGQVKIFRGRKRNPVKIAGKEGSLLTLCVINSALY